MRMEKNRGRAGICPFNALSFTWTLAFLALGGGCEIDRQFGSEGEADAATGTTDTAFEPTGTSDGPGATGSWPPAAGFDPIPDIGDNTLSHDVLLISETPVGRLYLFAHAERLGDTFQGSIGAAQHLDDWGSVGEIVAYDGLVVENRVGASALHLDLPAGTHPFGPTARVLEMSFDLQFYADRLLCGTLDLSLQGGESFSSVPVIAKPIVEVHADPMPPLLCE